MTPTEASIHRIRRLADDALVVVIVERASTVVQPVAAGTSMPGSAHAYWHCQTTYSVDAGFTSGR